MSPALCVQPQPSGFGAAVTGVDLTQPLSQETIAEIRSAWLKHRVICFPDQPMGHDELSRFTRYFGEFGENPYVEPVSTHPNIIEVKREPDEQPAPFGSAWHSDWSFQAEPPSATLLHAKEVPPIGGDTLFADGVRAFSALSPEEQQELESLTAVHSAHRPYSHHGFSAGGGQQRSMKIQPSDEAYATQEHPLVRTHPETGEKVLWVNTVYTVGLSGWRASEARAYIDRLCEHATQSRFIYRHRWAANMLTMWDNRSVQHCAQGGYDGYRRVMHRTIVAGDAPR